MLPRCSKMYWKNVLYNFCDASSFIAIETFLANSRNRDFVTKIEKWLLSTYVLTYVGNSVK